MKTYIVRLAARANPSTERNHRWDPDRAHVSIQ